MSFCRRDTARKLLAAIGNDDRFVDAVAEELAEGRMKRKYAEKAIVWWYQRPEKLMIELERSLLIFGV